MNEKLVAPSLVIILLVTVIGFGITQSNQNKYNAQMIQALNTIAERQQSSLPQTTVPSQQPTTVSPSSTSSNNSNDNASEYKPYTQWDLALEYPKTFFIDKYNDEFRYNQINLRITSQAGTLFRSSGGPARPQSHEFTEGYEMNIAKIMDAQDTVNAVAGRLVQTANPLVKEIRFECDGAGCDQAQYLITSRNGAYLVRVNSVNFDWDKTKAITERILSSIHE